jgi:hypothetical protein
MEHWLERVDPDPSRWNSKDRQKLDPLTRYLQRSCAKNDSTGRAGPIAVGSFSPTSPGTHAVETPLRDHYYMARWAAEAIIDWLGTITDLAAVTPPRRAPGVAVLDGQADRIRFDYSARGDLAALIGPQTRVSLCEDDSAVLRLCDGIRTPAEIGQLLDTVDVPASLDRLAGLDLIIRKPELPYGIEDPVPVLEQLAGLTDRTELKDLLAGFAEHAARLPDADLSTKKAALRALHTTFAEAIGEQPTRNSGGFYEDRTVVFDECVGRFDPLIVGKPLVSRIEKALPLIVDSYMFLPRLRDRAEQALMADWFVRRFPSRTASVNDYLAAFVSDYPRLRAAFDAIDDDTAEWADRLKRTAVASDEQAFTSFLTEHGPSDPIVCNIDLMLAGTSRIAEPARLIVSEVHSDEEMLSHSTDAPFVEQHFPGYTSEILAGYRSLLRQGEILMDVTQLHQDKTFVRRLLDCPDIEACGPSPAAPHQRRTFADFVVKYSGDGLRLVERRSGSPVRLAAVPFHWLGLPQNPMRVFGFPSRGPGNLFDLRAGEHLPEVSFGDVVLSRRAWSVPAAALGANHEDGFLAVQRVRSELGLPRHVFARSAREGKPIYLDLDSPLLVRQLSQFARRTTHISFSEMSPTPDQLWANGYTSELRFPVFDSRR